MIYKITEACKYIGVSINTLKTLANNGKLRSFKTNGGHRRFSQDDLDSYMGKFLNPENYPPNPSPAEPRVLIGAEVDEKMEECMNAEPKPSVSEGVDDRIFDIMCDLNTDGDANVTGKEEVRKQIVGYITSLLTATREHERERCSQIAEWYKIKMEEHFKVHIIGGKIAEEIRKGGSNG